MPQLATRRYRTAKKIQAAAVELAVRHGLSNITTEAISTAAGVSARTFFNYYPYKEAALMGPAPDYPTDAVAAFLTGRGALMDDLKILITAHLSRFVDEREMLGHVLRLSESDPKLEALRNSMVISRRGQISELLRSRMPNEHPRKLDILASAVIAATNSATKDWAQGPRTDFVQAAHEYLDMIIPAADLLRNN